MTDVVVSLAKAVDVYPDEFKVLLKVINRGLSNNYPYSPDEWLSNKEIQCLATFQEYFADLALNYGQ
jgi:hypothetical protein